MTRNSLRQRALEPLEQIALLVCELDRHFDLHVRVKIVRNARAHTVDALAAQPERLARLGAFRHGETRATCKRWHFNPAAKRHRGERNRLPAVQVVTVAFEHRMLLDVNLDVQVTARTAVDTQFAVTGHTA